jgi:excisionase family DNA binding protein
VRAECGLAVQVLLTKIRMMEKLPTRETIDILRTFAGPALVTGLLEKADLDVALHLLEDLIREPKQDRLITFTTAARQIGVSTKTVARMVESGELKGKRLRRHYANSMRIFQSSVNQVLSPDA